VSLLLPTVATVPVTTDDPVPEVQAELVPTLLERMTAVMGEERAQAWLGQGRVRVEGEVVNDPQRPTPLGQRWLISGS